MGGDRPGDGDCHKLLGALALIAYEDENAYGSKGKV
jgi:hypothetical protein